VGDASLTASSNAARLLTALRADVNMKLKADSASRSVLQYSKTMKPQDGGSGVTPMFSPYSRDVTFLSVSIPTPFFFSITVSLSGSVQVSE
jgi:hypothetical protein